MNVPITQPHSRATILVRWLAAGIDLLCLGIIARVMEFVVDVIQFNIRFPAPIETLAQVLAILLISSCEVWSEGSPGKYLCGLRIRSITGDRTPIHRRIMRWSLKTIPLWIVLIAALLEQNVTGRGGGLLDAHVRWTYTAATWATVGLFIAFAPVVSRSRQALYDMIGRTGVFPAKPEHLEHHRGFEPVIASPSDR